MKTNIQVIEKNSNNPGKTTVILAGVHGNEVCGVKAFNKIIPKLKIDSGKVIFIYANLEAIKQNRRFIEKNLNRCFLKNQSKEIKNTLEGRTAREIIPYLNKADFVLDIHASYTQGSRPFLICDKKLIKKSNIFDTKIISYNWDYFEPGSTDNYMNILNKPSFCFECGYLKSNKTQKIAEKSIYNFLKFTGNLRGKITYYKYTELLKIKKIFINKLPFIRKNSYKDFKKFNKKTIIGYEGNKPISANKGDIILFLRNSTGPNEECFLLAEETLINKDKLNKTKEEDK